jgi:hypothetical protein
MGLHLCPLRLAPWLTRLLAWHRARYETGRPEEALASLKESMQLWFKEEAGSSSDEDDDDDEGLGEEGLDAEGMEELGMGGEPARRSSGEGQEQETGARGPREVGDEEPHVPSYEFRIETAKLLLELDDSSETAVQVATLLLWLCGCGCGCCYCCCCCCCCSAC